MPTIEEMRDHARDIINPPIMRHAAVVEICRQWLDGHPEGAPAWYSKAEIHDWLIGKTHHEPIAEELAGLIAENYQLAFNKGFQMGGGTAKTTVEPTVHFDEQLRAALARITFENSVLDFKWAFEFETCHSAGGWFVWVTFERPDTLTGKVSRGKGRQEFIPYHSALSSVVKTAWLLVELMVRHELMEGFRFDGVRIFNPHNSVLDLAALQKAHDEKQKP